MGRGRQPAYYTQKERRWEQLALTEMKRNVTWKLQAPPTTPLSQSLLLQLQLLLLFLLLLLPLLLAIVVAVAASMEMHFKENGALLSF